MKKLISLLLIAQTIFSCTLERCVAPLDKCFNIVDIESFEIDPINGNNIIMCPSNNSLSCQFQVTGTIKHYMECPITYLYLVINSIDPSESIWHIQHPAFERLITQDGSKWKLIAQFGDTFDHIPQNGNKFKIKAILSDQEIGIYTTLNQIPNGINYSESATLEVLVQKVDCFEGSNITDFVIQKVDGATATSSMLVNCSSTDMACTLQIGGSVSIGQNLCPLYVHLFVQPLVGEGGLHYIQAPPLEISSQGNWSGFAHLGSQNSPPQHNQQFNITAIISDQSSRISDIQSIAQITDLDTKYHYKYIGSQSRIIKIDKTLQSCIDFKIVSDFLVNNPIDFATVGCLDNNPFPCRINISISGQGLITPNCDKDLVLVLVQPPGLPEWYIQDASAIYQSNLNTWEAVAQLGGIGLASPNSGDIFKVCAIYTEFVEEIKSLSPISDLDRISFPHLISDPINVIVQ